MTTFTDGPAHSKTLMLHRAPFFLRVVMSPDDIDALDQPEDTPNANELLFAYRLTKLPGHCHIRASKGRGGFFPIAEYALIDPQPTDAQMRDRDQWVAWCEANKSMADALKREWDSRASS